MILECRDLSKSFYTKKALNEVSLKLEGGKIAKIAQPEKDDLWSARGERKRKDHMDEDHLRSDKAYIRRGFVQGASVVLWR